MSWLKPQGKVRQLPRLAVVLAAAMRAGWRGPVFLQGDHFQFNATKWAGDPTAEMDGLKDLTREAIAAAKDDAFALNLDRTLLLLDTWFRLSALARERPV